MNTKNKTIVSAEPGKQDLFITREFDAPRDLVFRAYTEPALLEQWLGPNNNRIKVDYMNCVSNGSYRYVMPHPSGQEFGFFGVVHEVLPPERIIRTFEFEGLPERGHVALETVLFEALPGDRTRVTAQSVFKSVGDRNGMVKSGVEAGVTSSHQQLDDFLATLPNE